MLPVNETTEFLARLGMRLRDARLARNDTMAVFGERLGVSERTVRAMERGAATVQIGTWVSALWTLDRLEGLDAMLEPRDSLLDRARARAEPRRQRAARRSG